MASAYMEDVIQQHRDRNEENEAAIDRMLVSTILKDGTYPENKELGGKELELLTLEGVVENNLHLKPTGCLQSSCAQATCSTDDEVASVDRAMPPSAAIHCAPLGELNDDMQGVYVSATVLVEGSCFEVAEFFYAEVEDVAFEQINNMAIASNRYDGETELAELQKAVLPVTTRLQQLSDLLQQSNSSCNCVIAYTAADNSDDTNVAIVVTSGLNHCIVVNTSTPGFISLTQPSSEPVVTVYRLKQGDSVHIFSHSMVELAEKTLPGCTQLHAIGNIANFCRYCCAMPELPPNRTATQILHFWRDQHLHGCPQAADTADGHNQQPSYSLITLQPVR